MPPAETAAAAPYCQDQVRRFDHDRYLTALFAPAAAREALFALYAFNLEVAKTAEVVSEPMLGQIRLQWWREAVEGVYGGTPRRHEVVEPLAAAVELYGLDRALFDGLIDAREQDLADTAPPDLDALLAYAGATGGNLSRLAEQVLGGEGSDAAGAAGTAYALAGLIRAIPLHAARRQVFLPTALVEQVSVELGDLFELRPHAALARAVERLCEPLEQSIAKASVRGPRHQLAARLPATLARVYLKSLRKAGHDPFKPEVQRVHAGRQWALFLANLRGRA